MFEDIIQRIRLWWLDVWYFWATWGLPYPSGTMFVEEYYVKKEKILRNKKRSEEKEG